MSDRFRSRGIRILRDAGKGFTEQMKIYYEPDGCRIENSHIQTWMEQGILSLFEYAMLEGNLMDTCNFHVDLMREEYRKIYRDLPPDVREELELVPILFDESFRNYTVGYRIREGEVTGQSFYFYPTVLKGHRYGIKGVVDQEKIREQTDRFAAHVSKGDPVTEKEIKAYMKSVYKFKGISVHISGNNIGYKLYGRVAQEPLGRLLHEEMGYCIEKNSRYGEVVLTAQRIQKGNVTGYNIYYLA